LRKKRTCSHILGTRSQIMFPSLDLCSPGWAHDPHLWALHWTHVPRLGPHVGHIGHMFPDFGHMVPNIGHMFLTLGTRFSHWAHVLHIGHMLVTLGTHSPTLGTCSSTLGTCSPNWTLVPPHLGTVLFFLLI
jgi:hypothetical protein